MSLTREEIYTAWVPELPDDEFGLPWTNWAKPVLFATLGTAASTVSVEPPSTQTAAATVAPDWKRERLAIVIDLPGPSAVWRGMEFAEIGFRPVPLFNGCPGPGEVIDTSSVSNALQNSAQRLRDLRIDDDAPPVFLLDSRRMMPNTAIRPGLFDNRWLTFPQDFPSANLLLARRIERAVLLQEKPGQPQDDLTHVLRRWQEGGLRISVAGGPDGSQTEDLEVRKPAKFRSLWYRLRASMGLYPNSAGGFGAVIPQPSSG